MGTPTPIPTPDPNLPPPDPDPTHPTKEAPGRPDSPIDPGEPIDPGQPIDPDWEPALLIPREKQIRERTPDKRHREPPGK